MNGPEASDSENGHDLFRNARHVNRDPVASLYPQTLQHVSETLNLPMQRVVAKCTRLTLLTLPDKC